jgi:hypothetical protein
MSTENAKYNRKLGQMGLFGRLRAVEIGTTQSSAEYPNPIFGSSSRPFF